MTNQPFEFIKSIAFYLPQFHETDYNNAWWGEGFTEWTACKSAKPLFENHLQPHLPSDLGFHDQTEYETLSKQVDLAKSYGVHGFCHYFYWFNGKRVLEKPTELFLENKNLDMPFCLCWANENWSRRWDGADHEILIQQSYDKNNYKKFALSLAPYFSDPRYITTDGKVLFIIYRPDEVDDLDVLLEEVRSQSIACGHKGAFILGAETFVQHGSWVDPRDIGLDGAIEFPPHGVKVSEYRVTANTNRKFQGKVFDNFEAYMGSIARENPEYPMFRGLFPSWDNTARRKDRANIFVGSSPKLFSYWLLALFQWTTLIHETDKQFVFINAWNEWAEGAHLEPDVVMGRAYLEVIKKVLNNKADLNGSVDMEALQRLNLKQRAKHLRRHARDKRRQLSQNVMPVSNSRTESDFPFEIKKETFSMLLHDVFLARDISAKKRAIRKILYVQNPQLLSEHFRMSVFKGLRYFSNFG